jgi:hypothetical protein
MAMDPVRLLDQSDLSARERAALEAGQRQQPLAYDVAKGADRLGKALSQASASTVVTSSSVAAKLGMKLLFSAVLGTIAFFVSMQMTTPHASQTGAPRTPLQPVAEPTSPAQVALPARVAAPVSPATAAAKTEAPAPRKPQPRAVRAIPSAPLMATPLPAPAPALTSETTAPAGAAEPAAAEPHEPESAETTSVAPSPSPAMLEMKAIARAKRALSESAPDRALAILVGAARDFPRGYFVEERRALRVLALADKGESEQARKEAASFARDYPSGAFTARVKAAAER